MRLALDETFLFPIAVTRLHYMVFRVRNLRLSP